MLKIVENVYIHRGYVISKDDQGIRIHGCLHLFKTFADAKAYIDKYHDGSNKKEPVITGEWNAEKAGYR